MRGTSKAQEAPPKLSSRKVPSPREKARDRASQHASVGSKHRSHAGRARPTTGLRPSRGASQGRSLPTLEHRRSPRGFFEAPDPVPTLTYLKPLYEHQSRGPALLGACRSRADSRFTHLPELRTRAALWVELRARGRKPQHQLRRTAGAPAPRAGPDGTPRPSLPRWLQKVLLRMSGHCGSGEKTVEVSRWFVLPSFPRLLREKQTWDGRGSKEGAGLLARKGGTLHQGGRDDVSCGFNKKAETDLHKTGFTIRSNYNTQTNIRLIH